MLISQTPVSYTHLDVYKRQTQSSACVRVGKTIWVNGNMAVMADRLACVNSAVSGVCESESDEKRIE